MNNSMKCSICKKRMAVVFVTKMEGNETINEGLCLTCAKSMGIKPVNDFMRRMGITDEDVEKMSDDIMSFMDVDDSDENFEPGGSPTIFPSFLQDIGTPQKFRESPKSRDSSESSGNSSDRNREHHSKKKNKEKEKTKYKFLSNYCEHLTAKAREGKIDRIIGRDREIYRVIQILNRRTKNNPCLIGEPGVGKTAIAEGIAIRIAEGDISSRLADKEVFLLDLTALVAGTQFRGQFESRVKSLIDEVKSEGNIILFIDEVHSLVGVGDSEGSMNAANILKPALSRGDIQVIGATTFNEYRKYIEKDSALERRFQPVTIEEPTIDDTVKVLLGIKDYYEEHHRVKLPEQIVVDAVTLSERYITDRFLPDKAIDLLDEACSATALKSKTLSKLDSLIKRKNRINAKIENLENNLVFDENFPAQKEFATLAECKSEMAILERDIDEVSKELPRIAVETEDLAAVIELWTGIPASKITESNFKRLANLESNLKAKIIAQDEAVKLVAAAIRRSRVRITPRLRPASFIFVGPTGVGKTELVRSLATELFDGVEPLIRFDMSEFMEKHTVSRIIGSPPGYVGYDEAGQLTEKVRRKPYSVVLFDEIEKAHPDVLNILLQILDEGKVTDSHGRTVNFQNTVIVMTSNAGSDNKSGIVGFNKPKSVIEKEKAEKALSDFLRPEFISRIDEIIVFNSLDEAAFRQIAELMLDEFVPALKERNIELCYSEDVLALIAKKSFGGKYGARDIRRFIRKEVEDKIAIILTDAPELPPDKLTIVVEDEQLKVIANR